MTGEPANTFRYGHLQGANSRLACAGNPQAQACRRLDAIRPHISTFLLAVAVAMLISGCSALLTLNGDPRVDWPEGSSRSEVEQELGLPASTRAVEPSSNGPWHTADALSSRCASGCELTVYSFRAKEHIWDLAGLYLALDVWTLGLAELVTVPIEMTRGKTQRMAVIYDVDSKVVRRWAIPEGEPDP